MIRTFKSCRTYHKPICWCSQDDHSTHNRFDNPRVANQRFTSDTQSQTSLRNHSIATCKRLL
jgi:hypothetical protein